MNLQQLTAGDTLNFATAVTNFSAADGWQLHYRLAPTFPGGTPILLDSVADVASHRVQVTADVTATWLPGAYQWNSWVTRTTERYSVQTGTVQILPDPATFQPTIDARGSAQKSLDNALAMVAAIQAGGVELRIGDRMVKLPTLAEAEASVRYWQGQVSLQAAGITRAGPRIYGVNLR